MSENATKSDERKISSMSVKIYKDRLDELRDIQRSEQKSTGRKPTFAELIERKWTAGTRPAQTPDTDTNRPIQEVNSRSQPLEQLAGVLLQLSSELRGWLETGKNRENVGLFLQAVAQSMNRDTKSGLGSEVSQEDHGSADNEGGIEEVDRIEARHQESPPSPAKPGRKTGRK